VGLTSLFVLALSSSALARPPTARHAPKLPPKLPKDALPVPLVEQDTDYSCGAAALLAVLRYWQAQPTTCEEDLYGPLNTTPEDGTDPVHIEAVARAHGLDAAYRTELELDDLRQALGDGDTVILDLQAWRDDDTGDWATDWDDGHYVVLIGMDDTYVYVEDPSSEGVYGWIPLDDLPDRWHDEDHDVRAVHPAIVISGSHAVPAPAVDGMVQVE
jgi:predicted double-glycine peptidase